MNRILTQKLSVALLAAVMVLGVSLTAGCSSNSETTNQDIQVNPDGDTQGDDGASQLDLVNVDMKDVEEPHDLLEELADVSLPDGEVDEDGSGVDVQPPDIVSDETEPDGYQPVVACDVDADCDDLQDCTVDSCVDSDNGDRFCQWKPAPGTCRINGVCFEAGAITDNQCKLCDPDNSWNSWTFKANGSSCYEDECAMGGTCQDGDCVGASDAHCDDGNACTVDLCDPATVGCHHLQLSGIPCDDGDPCTTIDMCFVGACQGHAPITLCDDGNDCTADTCSSVDGSCVHQPFTGGSCQADDLCATSGSCDAGVCIPSGEKVCDDMNFCTIDLCNALTGCYHLPNQSPCCIGAVSACDDSNPCTDDSCDPETGDCSYQFNVADCDDQNACTSGDACIDGNCVGTTVECLDADPCTADSCDPASGCVFAPSSGEPCDDGQECSTGDVCVDGQCVGDLTGCVCTPEFQDAVKVVTLMIPEGNAEGEALDVDGNGSLDNTLGPLGGFANDPLASSVAGGDVMLLAEFRNRVGNNLIMAIYNGALDGANAGCDFQTQTCDYRADPSMILEDSCEPLVSLPATLNGNVITAGGPDVVMPFSIPFAAGVDLQLTVYMVRFIGTVTEVGGEIVALDGILAGAITETDLNNAIDALPPDTFADLGLTPETIKTLLSALAPNDINTTPLGIFDAKSIAIHMTAIDGNIVGVVE